MKGWFSLWDLDLREVSWTEDSYMKYLLPLHLSIPTAWTVQMPISVECIPFRIFIQGNTVQQKEESIAMQNNTAESQRCLREINHNEILTRLKFKKKQKLTSGITSVDCRYWPEGSQRTFSGIEMSHNLGLGGGYIGLYIFKPLLRMYN